MGGLDSPQGRAQGAILDTTFCSPATEPLSLTSYLLIRSTHHCPRHKHVFPGPRQQPPGASRAFTPASTLPAPHVQTCPHPSTPTRLNPSAPPIPHRSRTRLLIAVYKAHSPELTQPSSAFFYFLKHISFPPALGPRTPPWPR